MTVWDGLVGLLGRGRDVIVSAAFKAMSLAHPELLRRHTVEHGAETARIGASRRSLHAAENGGTVKRMLCPHQVGTRARLARRAAAAKPPQGNLLRTKWNAGGATLDPTRPRT